MDSNFFTQGSTNYQNALQEYTNTLSREKIDEEKVEAPIDDYNKKIADVFEPVGAAIIHQPALDVTKAGIKKILGKEGQKKALSAAKKLKAGEFRDAVSDASDALNAARQRVVDQAEGLGRAVAKVKTGIDADGVGAKGVSPGTINKLGVKPSRATKPRVDLSTEPANEPVPDDSAGRPTTVAELPEEEQAGAATTKGFADPIAALADRFEDLPGDSRAAIIHNYNQFKIAEPKTDTDYKTNLGLQKQLLEQQEEKLGIGSQSQVSLPTESQPAVGEAPRPPAPPVTQAEAGPDAIASEAGKAANVDSPAEAALKAANLDKENLSKAALKAQSIAAAGGEEGGIEGALGTASTVADEAAAGEGGANIFADVAAGAIGLATILAGVFGGKKEAAPTGPEFIPSAQFGI